MVPTLSALYIAVSVSLGLPTGLLSAICFTESNHAVTAVHYHDGDGHSYGACQLKYFTAQGLGYKGDAQGLIDPVVNTYWAGRYLHYQLHRYNGDIVGAVSAYNVGQYRTRDGKPVNLKYVRKVLKAWAEHK